MSSDFDIVNTYIFQAFNRKTYVQRYMEIGYVKWQRKRHEFKERKQEAKVRSSTRATAIYLFFFSFFLSREDIETLLSRARDIAGNERADGGKKLESGR